MSARISAAFGVVVALLGFVAVAARAEVPEWVSGKALLDQYEAVGPGRDARGDGNGTLQSSATLYGTASPKLSETVNAKATLRGSAYRRSLEHGKDFVFRGEVQELWLARGAGGLDVKLGQIVTPWGRSDAVNPTDFLTAKDLTTLSTTDEIRRRGAPGARLVYVPAGGTSPWEATVAWNARYPQTKMLIPTSGVPAGVVVDTDPGTPALFGDRQEWAAKLAYLASSFDVSLSGFSGRNHFGQFEWDGAKVATVFEKELAIGGDFSITFDDFILRGETAYFFYDSGPRGGSGASLTEPNHWDSVLGLERAFGPRVRILAQALYRVHPSRRDPSEYVGANATETAIGRGVGQANALIQNYQQKSEVGATLLATYTTEEEGWVFELGALGNFIGGDFVIRPKIRHKLRDSLHATLGMDYYGGPTDKTFGALRDYRSAYLEAEWAF
ncbi:MAG: hypothetical protein JST04_01950 [Bdellovibrionales bacterium]|nr:hypothetical protein [Bdellovibrionales bacterium]